MPKSRSQRLLQSVTAPTFAETEALLKDLPWFVLPVALAAVATLFSLNTYGCGWVWDDRAAIIGNQDLRPETPLVNLWTDDFWGTPMASPDSHKSYRPITVLTFRLNYLFSELFPSGYHLGNTLLHGAVTFVYALLSRELLKHETATLIGGLLFSIHPVHAEAVAGIVGRADVLSCFFYILAIIAYLKAAHARYTDWLFFLLSLAAASASALSKEAGFTAFALLVFYDAVCVFRCLDPAAVKAFVTEVLRGNGVGRLQELRRSCTQLWVRSAAVVGSLVLLVLPRLNLHGQTMMYTWTIMENHIMHSPSRFVRFLTYAYSHAVYWKLLWWPAGLSFDHGYDGVSFVTTLFDCRVLAIIVTYGMVLGWGLWAVRRQSVPQMLCIALLLGSWLPASHMLFPVGAVVAERLLYIPSVGFCIALSQIIVLLPSAITGDLDVRRAVRCLPFSLPSAANTTRILKWLLLFAFLLGSAKTWSRNAEWVDERSIFLTALETYPKSLKALNNIGMLKLNRAEALESVAYLEDALELYPDYSSARFNYGLALGLCDREVEGIENLQLSLELDPKSLKAWGYLGQAQVEVATMLNDANHPQEAEALYKTAASHIDKAIAGGIELPPVWHARGLAALNLEQYDNAIENFLVSLRMNAKAKAMGSTTDVMQEGNIYNNLLLCHKAVGNYAGALEMFEKGVAADPDMYELYNNAASVYLSLGRPDEALSLYKKADLIQPGDAVIQNNIGNAEEEMGNLEVALRFYEKALFALPTHPTLKENYARVAAALGR